MPLQLHREKKLMPWQHFVLSIHLCCCCTIHSSTLLAACVLGSTRGSDHARVLNIRHRRPPPLRIIPKEKTQAYLISPAAAVAETRAFPFHTEKTNRPHFRVVAVCPFCMHAQRAHTNIWAKLYYCKSRPRGDGGHPSFRLSSRQRDLWPPRCLG